MTYLNIDIKDNLYYIKFMNLDLDFALGITEGGEDLDMPGKIQNIKIFYFLF